MNKTVREALILMTQGECFFYMYRLVPSHLLPFSCQT